MPDALLRDGGCYTQPWRLEFAEPEPLAAAHAPPDVRDDPALLPAKCCQIRTVICSS
jgi:hypothetical protein